MRLWMQNGLFRDGSSLVTITASDGYASVNDTLNATYSFSSVAFVFSALPADYPAGIQAYAGLETDDYRLTESATVSWPGSKSASAARSFDGTVHGYGDFTGKDEGLVITDAFKKQDNTEDFTLSFWIQVKSACSEVYCTIAASSGYEGSGWRLYYWGTNLKLYNAGVGGYDWTTPESDWIGKWRHVVVTKSNGVWVDGNKVIFTAGRKRQLAEATGLADGQVQSWWYQALTKRRKAKQ